jgi:glutaredoxin 3
MIDEQAHIEIYTSRTCGYCYAAKSLLHEHGLAYTEVDVTFDAEKRREMMERSKQRTVPQIFIDGKPIGGYRDLVGLLK